MWREIKIHAALFFSFIFLIDCTPKPEPYLLGLLALPVTTEATSFQVSSTNPSNDQIGINTNTNITVTFSKNLDSASITGNVSFTQPSSGTISSLSATSSNRILTLRPSNVFLNSSTYTITIKAGIKSTTADTLGSDYVFRFTTQ
jgi:hypothetical protein